MRPIIDYGDVIYNNINKDDYAKLTNFQRTAALVCTGDYRHTQLINLLSELCWQTISMTGENVIA